MITVICTNHIDIFILLNKKSSYEFTKEILINPIILRVWYHKPYLCKLTTQSKSKWNTFFTTYNQNTCDSNSFCLWKCTPISAYSPNYLSRTWPLNDQETYFQQLRAGVLSITYEMRLNWAMIWLLYWMCKKMGKVQLFLQQASFKLSDAFSLSSLDSLPWPLRSPNPSSFPARTLFIHRQGREKRITRSLIQHSGQWSWSSEMTMLIKIVDLIVGWTIRWLKFDLADFWPLDVIWQPRLSVNWINRSMTIDSNIDRNV